MFNMINCRKIGSRDFNVFESFMHNTYFLFFFFLTGAIQFIGTQYFPSIFRTVPLTRGEWGSCICVASTVLIASALLKLTPLSWVEKINTGELIDENKEADNAMLEKAKRLSVKS